MAVRPLFLFSLPRAGSTLVQRVLASHPEISTTAEPWLLLPQLYATRLDGIYTEYGQIQSTKALTDFARELPQGEDEYRRELNRFISRLYARASSEGGGSCSGTCRSRSTSPHCRASTGPNFPDGWATPPGAGSTWASATSRSTSGSGRWPIPFERRGAAAICGGSERNAWR